jgi:hypothetical protein
MSKPLIGIIIQGKKGFTPIIGYAVDVGDDPDGPIFDVVGKQPPQKTLEDAQAFIIAEESIDIKYLKSVTSSACSIGGIIWLNPIIEAQ